MVASRCDLIRCGLLLTLFPAGSLSLLASVAAEQWQLDELGKGYDGLSGTGCSHEVHQQRGSGIPVGVDYKACLHHGLARDWIDYDGLFAGLVPVPT